MKKVLLAMVVVSSLAGCAGSPLGNLVNNERLETKNDVMASWVGAKEDELIINWGPPDNSYTLSNGAKIVSYQFIWGQYVGQRIHCVEKFMIEKGIVTKWGMDSTCRKSLNKPSTVSKDIPIPQPTL